VKKLFMKLFGISKPKEVPNGVNYVVPPLTIVVKDNVVDNTFTSPAEIVMSSIRKTGAKRIFKVWADYSKQKGDQTNVECLSQRLPENKRMIMMGFESSMGDVDEHEYVALVLEHSRENPWVCPYTRNINQRTLDTINRLVLITEGKVELIYFDVLNHVLVVITPKKGKRFSLSEFYCKYQEYVASLAV